MGEFHQVNPALILLSITPFGQSGPYRDYDADDTVLAALGGMLYVNGSAGRRPVRPLGLQAYHSSAYYGAIATSAHSSPATATAWASGST